MKEKDKIHLRDDQFVDPVPPKVSEFEDLPTITSFRGIGGVKPANETQMISREQAAYYANEIRRCAKDPQYFAEKYFTIISFRGKEKIKLFEKQKEMLNNFVKFPFNICVASRQSGKCVSKDSVIKIRNKRTGVIEDISIGDFFEKIKSLNNEKV